MEDVAGRERTTLCADAGALLANFSLERSRSATVALEYCVERLGVTLGGPGPPGSTMSRA